jgi:hypothetical protein
MMTMQTCHRLVCSNRRWVHWGCAVQQGVGEWWAGCLSCMHVASGVCGTVQEARL